MFSARRWERRHTNGWMSIVRQPQRDWYKGVVESMPDRVAEPVTDGIDFAMIQDATDQRVLDLAPHLCGFCQRWQEVTEPNADCDVIVHCFEHISEAARSRWDMWTVFVGDDQYGTHKSEDDAVAVGRRLAAELQRPLWLDGKGGYPLQRVI